MTTAANRPSSLRYFSNRPPISFSSFHFNDTTGLMHRSLDETQLPMERSNECHQVSSAVTTGNIAALAQSTSSSSPLDLIRRRPTNASSNMTSYSALKRKAQRSDVNSNLSRIQVNLEHVLGFTSTSNSVVSQDHSTLAYAAGSTVVLYNIHTRKQDFIINTARKAITSLALSPDGRYIATGECGHDPRVRIWDLANDRTTCIELGDHKFAIDCVCFSSNVDYLVSIGSVHDGNIYVWAWKEKKKLASNKCTCSIRRIAFSEDGSYFVTVGNRYVKFWYLMSTSSLEVVPLRGRYAILAERKDNLFVDVVCGRGDCAGMTYTITANGLICRFDEHRQMHGERDLQEKATCLAIGDSYLIVGCMKGAVYVFSPRTLDFIMSIPLPHHLGIDIAFVTSIDQMTYPKEQNLSFPDTIAINLDENTSLLTCFYNDHSLYIWDIKNERSIKKHDSHLYHSGCGWGIETYTKTNASPDILQQLSFITCSSDNSIRFWSLNQNATDSHSSANASTNIFSRQLMKIVYLDHDYSKLCDSQISQERQEFTPRVGGRCMKINPDGLSCAIGDRNGNIRIFQMESFEQVALIEAHDSEVLCVDYIHWADMGVTFLASSSRDRFVHIFDVAKDYQLVATLDDHSAAITTVRFTLSSITSNLQLITCSADKSLIFRSVTKSENGKYQFLRSNNIVEKQTFYDLAIDHTREFVSAACQDRMIRVYNLQDGKRVRTCKGSMGDESGYLIKIDIDSSGRYLATSCSNKCVYIWDTTTTECVATLCGHSEIVTDLKFHANGHYLYTISGDSCIFVWNIHESTTVPTTVSRGQLTSPTKSTESEIHDADESWSQTTSTTDNYSETSKRQRSVWGTVKPRLPSFESKSNRTPFSSSSNEGTNGKMVRSTSSQDNSSVFFDEDEDITVSTVANTTNGKMNSFLKENYEHDDDAITASIGSDKISANETQQRKSVSSRFRSLSKESSATETSITLSFSSNQESVPGISSTISHCPNKSFPAKTTVIATTDSKTTSPKAIATRKTRVHRARSEDRFRRSSVAYVNNVNDAATPSPDGHLPSYAAHTSSSMNKLRENSTVTVLPIPVAASSASSLNSSLSASSTKPRRIPSAVSMGTRLSSIKNMSKSHSTQSLILPTTASSTPVTNGQTSKVSAPRRIKLPRTPRRQPNLPPTAPTSTTSHAQSSSSCLSTSSSSSSPSPDISSPTKVKQHLPPCLQDCITPLHELDNSPNDLMPKWAQDCFYRTVVLGLKPLLLQDCPSSSLVRTASASSIESSDSLETTSELLTNQRQITVRRSISIPDCKQIEIKTNSDKHHKLETTVQSNDSISNEHRMTMIIRLVNDLQKHLTELETFYTTVSQSSDKHDLNMKQYIEQIYNELHVRITNNHRQHIKTSTVVNH